MCGSADEFDGGVGWLVPRWGVISNAHSKPHIEPASIVINIIFDYVTIEIYSYATKAIGLLVANTDQRLCSKMPIRGDSLQLRLARYFTSS